MQKYFHDLHYSNVIVYASNGHARNNVGLWQGNTVNVSNNIKGFEYYTIKDKAMAYNADYGFMI